MVYFPDFSDKPVVFKNDAPPSTYWFSLEEAVLNQSDFSHRRSMLDDVGKTLTPYIRHSLFFKPPSS